MRDPDDQIHSQNGSTRSIDDQIEIAHEMWAKGIGPNHDGLKASEIEEELDVDLDFAVRTSLGHLTEADIVEEFAPPGPDTFVIATWMDDGEGDIVNGNVTESAEEGLEALEDDIETGPASSSAATATDGSGITHRSVVASKFDIVPDKLEEFLRTTDRPVDVLNGSVEAIEEADEVEVGDDYGEIAFINMPYRYRLTEFAVSLYEK